nr:class I SAM-dependent methyltransferase [Marinilactibacillus kalidii]
MMLKEELQVSYMEALIETGENLLDNKTVRILDGKPSKYTQDELEALYENLDLSEIASNELRQAIQLSILRGMREDFVQANHQMTPDSIGSLMAYLVEVIAPPKNEIPYHLLDLSIGTGNLMFTLYHFLNRDKRELQLSGIDNDDLLLSLAATSAALQDVTISLTHQDALSNLLVNPADSIVSDLPVGYYPLDEQAEKFETSFSSGHSFSHHLLIEQGMNYLKDGGFGFYLVPSNVFESEEAKGLLSYIQKVGHFQGMLTLPKELFKTEQSRKSILIVQKSGEGTKQAKEVLLATAPDFKNLAAMQDLITEITQWKQNFLN